MTSTRRIRWLSCQTSLAVSLHIHMECPAECTLAPLHSRSKAHLDEHSFAHHETQATGKCLLEMDVLGNEWA